MSKFVPHIVVFLASMSAFLEQPLVGRILLPYTGGGAAAWVISLMFFQALLVAGYFLGYKLSRTSGKFSVILIVGVFAGPLLVISSLVSSADSVFNILSGMILLIPGYVVLTSTLILMSNRMVFLAPGKNPYRLAASSNAGSFVGLFVGLLFTEFIYLSVARWLWWGLLVFVVVSLIILLFPLNLKRKEVKEISFSTQKMVKPVFKWGALAALGSAFLVAYSGWFNENIVVMPLLWVLPLGIYLALFSLAFSGLLSNESFRTFFANYWGIVVGGFVFLLVGAFFVSNVLFAVVLGMMFFAVPVWFILTKLESIKPSEEHLSLFWIVVAVGGSIGGIFAGVVFPLLFNGFWEIYPLFIIPFALVGFTPAILGGRFVSLLSGSIFSFLFFYILWQTSDFGSTTIWGALVVLGTAAASVFSFKLLSNKLAVVAVMFYSLFGVVGLSFLNSDSDTAVVAEGRSLYGSWIVYENKDSQERLLSHNGIVHGFQSLDPALSDMPTSYYGSGTGVGNIFNLIQNSPSVLNRGNRDLRVGVVGLGVGVLAGWEEAGAKENWTFFEIDADMVNVAETYFSFLSGEENIVVGDARLSLQDIPDDSLDVLVLDAYLGDSVPTHLMTVEAYSLFAEKLKKDGVILSHVSNIYLNVDRVVVGSSSEVGFTSFIKSNPTFNQTDFLPRRNASTWILSTENTELMKILRNSGWQEVKDSNVGNFSPVVWTDDLTPFFRIIK